MFRDRQSADDYFVCPCCGAEVPAKANFCRECGASDESGWDEGGRSRDEEPDEGYGQDDDFDYDEFVQREFPEAAEGWSRQRVKKVLLTIVVIAVCLALLIWTIG